jgi:hypothetical protein
MAEVDLKPRRPVRLPDRLIMTLFAVLNIAFAVHISLGGRFRNRGGALVGGGPGYRVGGVAYLASMLVVPIIVWWPEKQARA